MSARTGHVVVLGASLAGMAAAARLAKAGHRITLVESGSRPGGRFAAYEEGAGLVDDLPPMITFPAPWRDLWRKSGRDLATQLEREGRELVAAPATRHVFDDGSELVLDAERGAQFAQLSEAYGDRAAARWRDLLDRLDDVWQALRPLGGEFELRGRDDIERSGLYRLLRPRDTVESVARELDEPHLAEIVRDTAWRLGSEPRRTPAWVAVALAVERTFGRWMLQRDGHAVRMGELVESLTDRLAVRKIDVRLDTPARSVDVRTRTVLVDGAEIVADALVGTVNPWAWHALTGERVPRALRAARAPKITHRPTAPGSEPSETIRHTPAGPVITWRLADRVVVHDHPAGVPDPGAGIAWRGARGWLRMPPIRTAHPGVFRAGPFSPGGAGLSSVLLSGALAAYATHDHLAADTG